MNWKKNGLSYCLWFVFVIISGMGVFGSVGVLYEKMELPVIAEIMVSVFVFLLAGIVVFICSKIWKAKDNYDETKKNSVWISCAEATEVLFFLVAGLIFRVQNIGNANEVSAYFEMAVMGNENTVPQMVHGAVYLYLKLLHTIFFYLGNKFIAIIWMQIVLQLGACFLLYCGIKNSVGRITAMIVLAMCTTSPYMISGSLTLSPQILYLFFFALVFCMATADADTKVNPLSFFIMGVLEAILFYFDIAGALLILLSIALIFRVREVETETKRKLIALICQIFGVVAGFTGCLVIDAFTCHKAIQNIFLAWFTLFAPSNVNIVYKIENTNAITEYCIFFGCMALGIFSFWRKKTDNLKVWISGFLIVLIAIGTNVFTKDMPGLLWLFLLASVLAGISVENCFACEKRKVEVDSVSADKKVEKADLEKKTENSENQTTNKVEFIENPLPLPKKHEKKTMDFQIENLDADDFDLRVSDEDDFDI